MLFHLRQWILFDSLENERVQSEFFDKNHSTYFKQWSHSIFAITDFFFRTHNHRRSFMNAMKIAAFKCDRNISLTFYCTPIGTWIFVKHLIGSSTIYLSVSIDVMQVATIFTTIMNRPRVYSHFLSLFSSQFIASTIEITLVTFVFETINLCIRCY